MSNVAVRFENVSKCYRLGSGQSSFREAFSAWPRRLLKRESKRHSADQMIWALKDINLEVYEGEALGIIGPNGSGKTTTLKLLAGITQPTCGQIEVNGRLSALIELGAGFHPDLTGRENIYLNGAILGLRRKEIDALFNRIVAFAELEPFIDTPVKRYSSGMYVRLAFSVAAQVEPDILLIDEVLSVGDLSFRYKCQQRMRALRDRGTTILFVSHSLNAVQGICDRAVFLLNGSIKDQGPAADVVQRYARWVSEGEFNKISPVTTLAEFTGDSVVELESARLLTADGRLTNQFSFGEDVRVQVKLRAKERIVRPIFTVIVVRSDGLRCCAARSSELEMDYLEGTCIIEARINALRLNGGAYEIVLAITDESIMAFFYERVASLLIIDAPLENIEGGGVYIPSVTWHCSTDGGTTYA